MPAPAEIETLAALLRSWRLRAGLGQAQVALAAGVGERTVRDLERARVARPRPATLDLLADALGLAPEERALVHEVAGGTGTADRSAPVAPVRRVPLPADPPDVTGRDAEVQALRDGVRAGRVVQVVHGPPGIGKSTVAVLAARRLARAVPDGAFFVDLRGTSPRPTTPRDALAQLLADLGQDDGAAPPSSTAQRLAAFRALTADRRGVLVLDDAADAEQVAPLLPAGEWSVIVSCRSSLPALDVHVRRLGSGDSGVGRVRVAELGDAQARDLLAAVVAPQRLAAQQAAADEVVRWCAGLPLAVRIVGSLLASSPSLEVAALAGQLRDVRARLDVLQAGDVAVRAAFAVSYAGLSPLQQACLRRAALLDWPDHDVDSLADLLGVGRRQAGELQAGLVEAGLSTAAGPGRTRLHDLLVVFGRERAEVDDDERAREEALERVRSRLVATVVEAAGWFRDGRPATTAAFGVPRRRFGSAARALAWLDEHRPALTWAIRRTAQGGRDAELVALVDAVRGLADRHHHLADWSGLFGLAVRAAERLGDARVEADLRNASGLALTHQVRRPDLALADHERAVQLSQRVGDDAGEAWSLLFSVVALQRAGRFAPALERGGRARRAFAALGDAEGALRCELAVGDVLRELGRAEDAAAVHRSAREAVADPAGEGRVTAGLLDLALGRDLAASGRSRDAAAAMGAALAALRAAHHPAGTAACLAEWAELRAARGERGCGVLAAEAVRAARDVGDLAVQAQAWFALALSARAAGRADDACRYAGRARRLCPTGDHDGRRLHARIEAAFAFCR